MPSAQASSIAQNIRQNIQRLRQLRGFSQAQVARLAGVPRPTLANLESGAANPTIAVLGKIAAALEVSVEELIGTPRAQCKFYAASALETRMRQGVQIRRVLPDRLQSMNLERMELEPRSRFPGVPHRTGTREYLTCEAGQIELTVAGENFLLSRGDVVVFRGDQKHAYRNPGSFTAVAYSAVLLGPV